MAIQAIYDIKVNTGSGVAEVDALARKIDQVTGKPSEIKVGFQSLDALKNKLKDLESKRDSALDFTTAKKAQTDINGVEKEIEKLNNELGSTKKASEESLGFFGKIKEGLAGIGTISIGTAIGDGLKDMFSGFVEKAHVADKAADDLTIGLSKAGVVGDAAKVQIAGLGVAAEKIADDFALPKTEVTELQAKIAGFGNVSGESLNKITEFSLGAANALQLPADAVAKLIAKSADPEQEAALSKLGITFDKNATAAQKMATLQAKLGPVVDETKKSTRDAVGDFDRLKNIVEEAGLSFASTTFEALQPVFQQLMPVVVEVGHSLGSVATVVGDVTHFMIDHKAIVASVVVGYAAFRAVLAVKELGGFAATLAKGNLALLDFGKSIVQKVIPGLGAQVVAQEAVTVAEGEAAVAGEAAGVAATLALGPIGILIGLAGVAVGAFFLLKSHTKDLGEATKDANESLENFNNTVAKTDDAIKQASSLDDLAARYDALKGKPTLTAKEQEELNNVTKQLADSMPEAVSNVDAYSGSVTIATSKVRELTKEQSGVASEEKKDSLDALRDSTIDLANSYKAAQVNVVDLKTKQEVLSKGVPIPISFFDALKQGVGIMGDAKEKQKEVTHELVEQRKQMQAAAPQLRENIKALESQGLSAEEVAKQLGLSVEQVKSLTAEHKLATAALKEQKQTVAQIAEEFNKTQQSFQKSFTDSSTAATDAIDILNKAVANRKTLTDPQAIKDSDDFIKKQKEVVAAAQLGAINMKGVLDARELAAATQKAQQINEILDRGGFTQEEQIARINTSYQDRLDKTRKVLDIAEQINKKASDEFEIKARQSNLQHTIALPDQLKELELRVTQIGLELKAADAVKQYTIGLLANDALSAKIVGKKKEEQEVLNKIFELQKKISGDALKFGNDLQDALDAITLSEVEIGIRPKSDAFKVMHDAIQRLQDQVDDDNSKLRLGNITPEEQQRLVLEVDALGVRINNKTKELNDGLRKQQEDLEDARINAMKDGSAKELVTLQVRHDREIQEIERTNNEQGVVTARGKELLLLAEKRFSLDLTELRKKYGEQDLSAIKTVDDAALAAINKLNEIKQQRSADEINKQKADLAKQQEDLRRSLARGQISLSKYTDEVNRLSDERKKVESDNLDSLGDRLKESGQTFLSSIGDAYQKFFDDLSQKYILDAILFKQTEDSKTAALQAAALARQGASDTEINAALAAGNASIFSAAMTAAGKAIASLPFPFDVIAGIAEAVAVKEGLGAIRKSIGFSRGGMLGLVNEGGQKEVIGPVDDFSRLMNDTVRMMREEIRRTLDPETKGSGSWGVKGSGSWSVGVKGILVSRGRDLTYSINNDSLSNLNERVPSIRSKPQLSKSKAGGSWTITGN